ncbi:MAG: ERCC4 domain-containing protein [Firmicutes bacterium]|nr:ERCC4 domain-containing protein [Bacillota bacterium]
MMQIYTRKELDRFAKSIQIVIDTREKEINHILKFYSKMKISFVREKLDFGDYTYRLIELPEFVPKMVVERKRNLEELSSNLTHARERFVKEFERAREHEMVLLVEQGSIDAIIEHRYSTNVTPASFLGSLMAFEQRYCLKTHYISPKHTGNYIYRLFEKHLRENFKK